MFDAPNINLLWARLLVEELVRSGVKMFCIAPGSRSAPLVVAASENPRAHTIVHYDERGLGFFALGCAKVQGVPVALISTSGTAAAEFFPAVIEAAMDGVPLLILTADRPPELLDCRANQAIDQTRLYGVYPRWHTTLPCPDENIAPELVLTTADHAVSRALHASAGPVHINCMFREPLAPTPTGWNAEAYTAHLGAWLSSDRPYTAYAPVKTVLDADARCALEELLQSAQRGILVVGRLRTRKEIRSAETLSAILGWPTFPDITSGMRLGPCAPTIVPYWDLLLASEKCRTEWKPDVVLHVGGGVTSKRFLEYIAACSSVSYVRVADHPFRDDPVHRVTFRIETDIASFVDGMVSIQMEPANWTKQWLYASANAGKCIDEQLSTEQELNEAVIARCVSQLATENRVLFLGNSMPVRDMDMYGAAGGASMQVYANRGASGIDGTVATAAGLAWANEEVTRASRPCMNMAGTAMIQPVTALLGDMAVLHDLNSLVLLKNTPVPVILVIINNNGGGIFSFLPIAAFDKPFEEYFAAPHGLAFGDAARMYGIPYFRVNTLSAFEAAYRNALVSGASAIIEATVQRKNNVEVHQRLLSKIRAEFERY